MNEWNRLKWDFKELSTSANFMDLSISIKDNKLHTTLYKKEMNLHLYISPASAHPPGLIAGMIKGMIHQINALCLDDLDKRKRLKIFYRHLLLRGWKKNKILPFFLNKTGQKLIKTNKEKIYLHLKYHPIIPLPDITTTVV